VDQAAEAIAADDLAGWLDGPASRQRRDQPERLVRPRGVVVIDVRAQDPLEVALADDEQPVQALPADCPHPAFRVGVRARRPERRAHDAHALRAEHTIERGGELGVAIAEEQLRFDAPLLQLPDDVPGLLRHPGGGRLRGAARDEDAARVHFDEEEDVEGLQPDGLDDEEVTGDERPGVGTKERPPGQTRSAGAEGTPLRRRSVRTAVAETS